MFPEIPDDDWGEAWYGRIAMTKNHLPRLKEVGPDGIAIYGYNGRGIGPRFRLRPRNRQIFRNRGRGAFFTPGASNLSSPSAASL